MSAAPVYRIGLIADTHGLLRPEVHTAFAGVEHIVHAGDVGDADILIELRTIAPVTAVWGNVDDFQLRQQLPERARIELAGIRIGVIHGQQLLVPGWKFVLPEFPDADLVVLGHSHQAVIERIGKTLVINPGSAGPGRFGMAATVAIVEVVNGVVEGRIIDLRQ